MNNSDGVPSYDAGNIARVLDVAEKALTIRSLEELSETLLPSVVLASQSSGVLLYIDDPIFEKPRLVQYGYAEEMVTKLDRVCSRQLATVWDQTNHAAFPEATLPDVNGMPKLQAYLLQTVKPCRGFIAFSPLPGYGSIQTELQGKLITIVSNVVGICVETAKHKQQVNHLNAYMTVSTMLPQALGLHQLLETVLYCCMEVVSAETASVLLLDDDRRNFYFFQVEGPTKPLLMKATFSADTGIAGAVLRSQKSEIIDDVPSDPRFYRELDSKSGFVTKNMIALPITADGEQLGVLEIINKVGGGHFSQAERLVLVSIADETSFAIRNAKIFEYVVNTYCKQRQGLNSCKGCTRPLGSWTPCAKYREHEI